MEQRTLYFLTAVVLAAMGVLFLINAVHFFSPTAATRDLQEISTGNVEQVRLERAGVFVTLSEVKGKTFIEALSRAERLDEEIYLQLELEPVSFDRIFIDRKGKSAVVLTSIGSKNGQLVFEKSGAFFIEKAPPKILQTFESENLQ